MNNERSPRRLVDNDENTNQDTQKLGEPLLRIRSLCKSFGDTRAVDGVDLSVPRGSIFGLLGPNGAGKTTIVRMLATLLRPDSGRITVGGHDTTTEPEAVRRSIGLSGQFASVDEKLTGAENLYLVGRLYGMSRRTARSRATEMLGRFRLTEAADRRAQHYSGGMRRRLDLAGALLARPELVVLDEPTTGLDPRSRMDTWEIIGELVAEGATVLLTTQYLEEADRLAGRIAVLSAGRIVERGTPDQLKARTGGQRLDVTVPVEELEVTARILGALAQSTPTVDPVNRRVEVAVPHGRSAMTEALRRFTEAGIEPLDMALRRATLDDVFLALTEEPAMEPDRTGELTS